MSLGGQQPKATLFYIIISNTCDKSCLYFTKPGFATLYRSNKTTCNQAAPII